MMPNPPRQTDPALGDRVPLPPRPIPANDAPPGIAPAAGRPARDAPTEAAKPGPAASLPPIAPAPPPAAETHAPTPVPRDGAQRAAFDALRLALREEHVFAALTGPAGAGKTAVLDATLAARSGRRLRTIRIVEADRVTAELAARIEQVAYAEAAKPANADAHVVLAVDDAHTASDELLRCLTRLAAGRTVRLPQILLAGRPELWDRLAAEEYAPLTARLAIRPMLPVPHPAPPEDLWASVERDLGRGRDHPKADPPPGADPAPPTAGVRPVAPSPLAIPATPKGVDPPEGGVQGGADRTSPPDLIAPLAEAMPGLAVPAAERSAERRRGRVFVPLAVLLAAAGVGLYALSRHDWSGERLAAAAWAEAGRHVSITQAPAPEPAAGRPAPVPQPSAPPGTLAAAPPVSAPPAPVTVPPTTAPLAPATVLSTPATVLSTPVTAPPDPAPATADAPPPVPAPSGGRGAPPPAMQAAVSPAPVGAMAAPAPAEPTPMPLARPEARLPAAPPPPAQPEIVALLLRRGDERLALGDISAARLFYERAASVGSARGARLAARTYDRAFLDPAAAGATADTKAALDWYRRAAALGDAEAVARLRQIETER